MAEDDVEQGVLIQGGDDAIYFIPSDRLDEFRVEDEAGAKAQASIEKIAEEREAEVAGYSMSFNLMPGVTSLRAFEGGLVGGTTKKTKTMYNTT